MSYGHVGGAVVTLKAELVVSSSTGRRSVLTNMVGAIGFEPTTSWSQTRRATGLRYAPKLKL